MNGIISIIILQAFSGANGAIKTPPEIIQIMENSKTTYSINSDPNANFSFSEFEKDDPLADPNWYVVEKEGKWQINKYSPNSCSEKLSKIAIENLASNKYDSSISAYKSALICDPNYKKYLTYIGNSYFMKGKYDSAEKYLKQSLVENSNDYQAHFFLADVYAHTNRNELAKIELVYAIMLNRHNPTIKSFTSNFLKKNNLGQFGEPFNLGFSVKKTESGVQINIANFSHVPAATCFATWMYDDSLLAYRKDDDMLKRTMLKNMIANQYIYGFSKLKNKDTIDSETRKIINIVDENLMQTMLLWEQASKISPEIIYTLPVSEKDKIRHYIEKYLIVKP